MRTPQMLSGTSKQLAETAQLALLVSEQSKTIARLEAAQVATNAELARVNSTLQTLITLLSAVSPSAGGALASPTLLAGVQATSVSVTHISVSASPSPPPAAATAAHLGPSHANVLPVLPVFGEINTLSDFVNVWWGRDYHVAETALMARTGNPRDFG